ncbi:hypothetical protein GGR52DRAFT_575728 [Hypoxylon sp. FL1284]|nr:hypothetical protein GGR52DRAFT_575728 [Hypoxylon sp. FL1284]
MYARLRSPQIPTPAKSDPPQQLKAFKHRLFAGKDEENDGRPSTPKRKRYSIAPIFDRYKRPRHDEAGNSQCRYYDRRRRPSPSPEPDPPLVTELNDLRATLHSAAMEALEGAEAELVDAAGDDVRANRQRLATLEARASRLLAPLRDLTVDYTATDSAGRRTVAVAIRDAAEAQAELEDVGREIRMMALSSSNGSSVSEDGRGMGAGSVSSGRAPTQDGAKAGFRKDLEDASREVVDEMRIYEEVSCPIMAGCGSRRSFFRRLRRRPGIFCTPSLTAETMAVVVVGAAAAAAWETVGEAGDFRDDRRARMLRVRARFSARTARRGVMDCMVEVFLDDTGGEL